MELLPIIAQGVDIGALFDRFGVTAPLLISQMIGFLIFALLLKKFAFGPIQQMLDERRNRIIQGEENLIKIEEQLAASEENTAAAIARANEEAIRLIDEAKLGAVALSEQKAQEALAQARQIILKAEASARAEREEISAALKREFGRLVAETTSQVTGKVLTDDDQRRINAEALAKVEG